MASLPTSAPVTPLRPGERREGKNDDADKADSVGTGTTGTAGTTETNQQLLVNSLPTHVGFPTLTAIGGAGVGRPGPTTWAFLDPRRPDLVPVFGPTIAYPSLNSLYETEEVATGLAFDGGMSPVRRFFCLFVTFDFLLTALMWMLSIVITGVNLTEGLQEEIKHYSIYTSLFDLVLVSVSRFVFLILMFGLCKFTHWWPVALATTGSCAFLVAKVFLYSWTQHKTYMFEVVFLLAGFILPWGEAWFVDFRVLPLESKASKLLFRPSSEREPLLGAEGGFRTPRAGSVIDRYTASVSNFYSPLASSGASQYGPEEEEEDDGTMYRLYSSKGKAAFTEQEEHYRRQGEELVALCWDLLNNANWIQERATSAGELMYSARHPDMRMKLYKIHARLECSPKDLLHEVFYNAEAAPTWNANLKETKVVQIVDEFTDVLYQVTNEAAGGLISSRDFIDLRRWAIMEGGVYLSTGKSILHSGVPPRRGIVRGENGPSCIALFPVPGMPECAEIRAMIQTDLKGWIPQKIIDQAMRDVMSKSVEFMRRRVPLIKVSKQRDALIAIP